MANIQIQKPHTITTTAIVQQQSQEVVQTIVHGGLSSLSYLREFFPEKAFVHRVYGEEDALPSYEKYAAGRLPATKRRSSGVESTNMQLLQRGKSRRVDMLLDWLEHGAFPAMKTGNLRALQVFVHADAEDRSQVIESYIFTVKYVRDAGDRQVPAGIEVGRADSEDVTIGRTSCALQELIRQINRLCEDMPQLPVKRYVSMALMYNEDSRIPEGWTAATSDKLFLGEADGWARHDETFDGVFSQFHETTFEVSYLQPASEIGNVTFSSSTIPNQLDYTRVRSIPAGTLFDATDTGATAEAGQSALDEVLDAFAATQFPEQPISSAAPDSESVPTQSLDPATYGREWEATTSSHRPSISGRVVGITETQSSNVVEMRDAFLAMMQPEQITQGDTQAQAPLYARNAESETTASPSRGEPTPSARKSEAAPNGGTRLQLSESALARLEQRKAKRAGHTNTKSKSLKGKDQDIIACQCGCTDEEGDMISCGSCGRWQHLHCYGFRGKDDPRIPDEYVCYQCLLLDREHEVFKKLCKLAQKRRVMHDIMQEGPKKADQIASSLQMAVSDLEPIVSQLHEAGHIVATKGGKKGSSSKVAYSTVKRGSKYDAMLREVFEPLELISHHYRTPQVLSKPPLTARLFDMSEIQMPPPTTPASRLRMFTQTPGSGLDLPGAESPSKTPSKVQGLPSSGAKRLRQDLAADAADGGRVKRVQTQYLLNAGGLSSSPAPSLNG